jgi:hypothetical protein
MASLSVKIRCIVSMVREKNTEAMLCESGKMTSPAMERGMITILNKGTKMILIRIPTHETNPKR